MQKIIINGIYYDYNAGKGVDTIRINLSPTLKEYTSPTETRRDISSIYSSIRNFEKDLEQHIGIRRIGEIEQYTNPLLIEEKKKFLLPSDDNSIQLVNLEHKITTGIDTSFVLDSKNLTQKNIGYLFDRFFILYSDAKMVDPTNMFKNEIEFILAQKNLDDIHFDELKQLK